MSVRDLDSSVSRSLPATEGAACLFWSRERRFIAICADGELKKVDVQRGQPQILAESASSRPPTARYLGESAIYLASLNGGSPEMLVKADSNSTTPNWVGRSGKMLGRAAEDRPRIFNCLFRPMSGTLPRT